LCAQYDSIKQQSLASINSIHVIKTRYQEDELTGTRITYESMNYQSNQNILPLNITQSALNQIENLKKQNSKLKKMAEEATNPKRLKSFVEIKTNIERVRLNSQIELAKEQVRPHL